MMSRTVRYAVDRREGEFLVLVDENGAQLDVPANSIAPDCRRAGTVLDVPLGTNDYPRWKDARRNREEEQRRLKEASATLERLRKRDPGGDVSL
jgi:hypothetical protein